MQCEMEQGLIIFSQTKQYNENISLFSKRINDIRVSVK